MLKFQVGKEKTKIKDSVGTVLTYTYTVPVVLGDELFQLYIYAGMYVYTLLTLLFNLPLLLAIG